MVVCQPKYEDYLDFKKGVYIFKEKGHLTSEGLKNLKEIGSGMNNLRKF